MTDDLSPAVVALARSGQEQARTRVLKALQPILERFFRARIGGHRAEVDDLVQNTLVRVHTSLADLNDPAAFKAFAMKAALFELQDYYRGRYRAKESLLDPDQPLPGDVEDAPGTAIDVARALASLSPRARRIMELRAYGYRYEEIAGLVDSSEAAIKMQVKRAIEKLRDLMVALALLVAASAAGASSG